AELRQRIEKCLAFLESVQAKDLAGGEERKVAPPWLAGKWLRGDDYLVHVAIPNFFFHATMAYAILRHNGVALGKMDYIGSMPAKERTMIGERVIVGTGMGAFSLEADGRRDGGAVSGRHDGGSEA